MAEFEVLNANGRKVGSVDLSDGVFFGEVKEHLVQLVLDGKLAEGDRQAAADLARQFTNNRGQT